MNMVCKKCKDKLTEICAHTEVCECGGTATFMGWNPGDGRIPILKCRLCGDTFDAVEGVWLDDSDSDSDSGSDNDNAPIDYEVNIPYTMSFTIHSEKPLTMEELLKQCHESGDGKLITYDDEHAEVTAGKVRDDKQIAQKCLLCGNQANPDLVRLDVDLCYDCHRKVLSEIFSIEG